MRAMQFTSAFAGIEGFGLALERLGMECTFQIEINEWRRFVLEREWPDVPKAGDIREVHGSDIGSPDLFVAGYPCKDLCIGKGDRRGLDGERSSLFWDAHRLIDESLRLVDATRPRWVVLENVPGIIGYRPHSGGRSTTPSNGGRDMAAVVLGLEELGYGWAYRVVDSRSVGSSQRRPRVIVVGHLGGDPRPAWLVLADREAGREPPGLRLEPTGEERGLGAARPTDGGARFARKSARPTKKAALGGYSTWVESDFLNVLNPNDAVRVDKHGNVTGLAPEKQTHFVFQNGRLRVLTPLEWERGQGFPDGWTQGMPDAERMYALGDAMNVPLADWLGRRILEVDAALPMHPAMLA